MNLTKREAEVTTLLAQGLKQYQIAQRLKVSRHTIYAHVLNIREKTRAESVFEIAVNAARVR